MKLNSSRAGRPVSNKWEVIAAGMQRGDRVVVRDYNCAARLVEELRLRDYRGEKALVCMVWAGLATAYIVLNAGMLAAGLMDCCVECRQGRCRNCQRGRRLDPKRSVVACECRHDEYLEFVGFVRGRPGFGRKLGTGE